MHALAVNRSDGKVRGATRGRSPSGFGSHAPINDHEFRRAIPPSRHNLGWRFGAGHFLATGHGSSRVPAINIKPTRRGHFQCVSQRLPSHFIASVRYGTNVAKEPMNAVHEKRTSRSGEQNDR